MTTHTSGAADLPEALTADQWLDLAIRHANKDWNSAQPDGYANAVKALCADFAALTAQAPSQLGGFDAGDMASAAAQGFRDGLAAAQAISAEPAGAGYAELPEFEELGDDLIDLACSTGCAKGGSAMTPDKTPTADSVLEGKQ